MAKRTAQPDFFSVRPPYIRHHLSDDKKHPTKKLRGTRRVGTAVDRFSDLLLTFRKKRADGIEHIKYGKHIRPVLELFEQFADVACLDERRPEQFGRKSLLEAFKTEAVLMCECVEQKLASHSEDMLSLPVGETRTTQDKENKDKVHKRWKQLNRLNAALIVAGVDQSSLPNLKNYEMVVQMVDELFESKPVPPARRKKMTQARLAALNARPDDPA